MERWRGKGEVERESGKGVMMVLVDYDDEDNIMKVGVMEYR